MTEEIDPKGDVLLQFPGPDSDSPTPPDPFNLRVSSSVLCLVSPVFSALFNGHMAEAQAFRAPGSPRPFPLTLPEDDPAIFSILANVIHHRADRIPFLPSSSTLVSLASLVDKYACAQAVMPYGVIWIQRATSGNGASIPGPESRTLGTAGQQGQDNSNSEFATLLGRCNLLLFAYVLDLPTQFAALSWDVLLMHRQTLKDEMECGLELPIPPDHELLRHDLHGELARRKARLRQTVHAALMEPVSRVTAQLHTNYFHSFNNNANTPDTTTSYTNYSYPHSHSHSHSPPESRTTCPNAAQAIGNYMALLDMYNLSPWRPQYETDSFSSIISRALEVARQGRDNPALFFEMCTRHRCACDNMVYGDGVHLADRLAFGLGGAWTWKLWVCLDCLKGLGGGGGGSAGSGSGSGSSCRVKHW